MNSLPHRSNGIVGLSATRRLPRLGKIKLGIKAVSKNGSEYPKDVDYFVCPPEVQLRYGEKPKELEIMFPVDNEDHIFPQALKVYSKTGGLLCRGDGEQAERRRMHLVIKSGGESPRVLDDARRRLIDGTPAEGDPNEWVPVSCIGCPLREKTNGKPALCGAKANLMVMLYNVNIGGVYQIDTGSVHNIINLNSSFDYARGLVGRIAMIPFKLRRVPRQIQYDGKVVTKHLLQLDPDMDLKELVGLRRDTKAILARSAGLTLPAPALEALPATPPVIDDAILAPEDEDEAAGAAPAAEPAPELTRDEVRDLAILRRRKLGPDRDEQLRRLSDIVDHPIASSKDLTRDEWVACYDALNALPDLPPEPQEPNDVRGAGGVEGATLPGGSKPAPASTGVDPAAVAETDRELWGGTEEQPSEPEWKRLDAKQQAMRDRVVRLAVSVGWANAADKTVLCPEKVRGCFTVDPGPYIDPARIVTRPAPTKVVAMYEEAVEAERARKREAAPA